MCVAYILSTPLPKEYEDTLKTFEFISVCLKSGVLFYLHESLDLEI